MTMFMKRIFNFGFLGVLATAGVLQAAQQAKFHLPFTATWGTVTLAPGDYSITLPEVGLAQRTFDITGEGTHAYIPVMTMGQTHRAASDRAYLSLQNVNGNYYVQSYSSGSSEREFDFMLPKANHRVNYGKRQTLKLDASGM